MYNDTIKVANKIISESDLMDIFQRMNDEIKENEQICRQETMQNEKYERDYQHWTTKDFQGTIKCTFNFYDDTNITVDNYNAFITVFNNRLHEVKDMWLRYSYSYWIQNGRDQKMISQHINMNIYEYKMDIEVNLSSDDKKMDDVYQLIKEKILKAPERYDRVIKKKSSITNKIGFALGMIPSLVICTLLVFVPAIRQIYGMTYVLFPIAVVILAFMIGNTVFGGKLDRLYSTIVPEKKYDHYDTSSGRSVYKDDIDKFVGTSEIIIGKNINNINNRKEIVNLEKKYSGYIPTELIALLVLSIIMILVGKFIYEVFMNKNIDIQLLQDTIDDLKNNPNACTTIGGMTSTDGSITIPESNPGEQLSKFIQYIFENGFADMQYVQNFEKIRDKQIEDYTYEETLTALTKIVRGDRFVSGEIYGCFKDGTLLKIIEKLKSFVVPSQNQTNVAMDMARMMNYRLHAEQLYVPILNGFQVENDNNPQTILLASGHGYIEQLTSDGHIYDGQFEQRIDLVIKNTKDFMRSNNCENVDNSFIYYKDYNNGIFNFKLYFQDMIIPVQNEKKVIRNLLAYFVEPKMHDFYQFSLGAGPFTMPTELLKVGTVDLQSDQVTMALDKLMTQLLDNLKYKN